VTALPLVHRRLHAAVERLTTGEGTPQERLQDAYHQFLADLGPADFPPALRRRYRALQRRTIPRTAVTAGGVIVLEPWRPGIAEAARAIRQMDRLLTDLSRSPR